MKLLLISMLALATLPSIILGVHFGVANSTTQKYCLILESNITGTLTFPNKENSTTTVQFTVPEDGSVDLNTDASICSDTVEKIQFDFVPDLKTKVPETEAQEKWSINFAFTKTGKEAEEHFELSDYALTVRYYPSMNSTYTNDTVPHVYEKQDKFQPEWAANVATHNGFICSQNQLPLNLTDASIQFNKLKVLAFVNQNDSNFTQNQAFEQCPLDLRTSDLVPIIVGACLAGMVIVVLIAYLIGRARAKRQGYASV